ncbi:MAG: ATP-binding protein [Capnocytophaga sp.]|nr:MAG: ATP-binding protein [Capnocytophaga sp.]
MIKNVYICALNRMVMLLRFKIQNFLSFYKEASFDMFPNTKREKLSHHIHNEEVPLLKQAAIYGANGAGKSNFVKAIQFLRHFIKEEDFLKNIDVEDYFFQLVAKKEDKISFEIEFLHNQKYYFYKVAIGKEVVEEQLFLSGIGKQEDTLVFHRRGVEIIAPSLENEKAVYQLLSLNPKASLLPLNMKFPIFSSQELKEVYDWFSHKVEIVTINSIIPTLIHLLSQDKKMLHFTNKVFERIGVGIDKITIGQTPLDKWLSQNKNTQQIQQLIDSDSTPTNITQIENNRNVLHIAIQKGTKTIEELLFSQKGQQGYQKEMKIAAQSDGTVRLLTLIPALYAAIYQGKVLFVDEIDNSIHPNLMFNLLRFYADHPSKGQLIFTTHTTHLLNQQELMRPDEVWLTEKKEGATELYSLNEFKLHNTLNIENGYLEGRYGGVPEIEEMEVLL